MMGLYGESPMATLPQVYQIRNTCNAAILRSKSCYRATQTLASTKSRRQICSGCTTDALKKRVGRVILAADAAHVNNPFGGYGCMAAVLDVGGLADCLAGYYEGKANEDILDLYANIRREKFVTFIDKRSRKNLERISQTDPNTVLQTDPFLNLLKGLEGDVNGTKDFLLVSLS
jgi:2-polyprenyl-6-methoxyphenol hydroxylase-like FAD-dependent oxidoreductase